MKDVSVDYITKEEADQRKPVELYHLWRDVGEHWYYTDGDVSVVFDANTYVPAILSRSLVKYDTQLEVTAMDIDASYVENPLLEYIATNPVAIVWVCNMKLHRDQDPLEASVNFVGQIRDVSFKGAAAKVNCVGFEHFLKQTVPRWRYQINCNHRVFDSKCSLDASLYKTTTAVMLDATKTQLTSADFGAQVDGYFIGGKVTFGIESRTVIAHTGSVVTLMYKFSELADGDTVDAFSGCNGRVETCRDKFNNVINFLGFPFIPVENPALRTP
jgi:uncharacterized phage protein (TIGR02218 family)